jgi:uncharacterized membrane protein YfcA
MFDLSWFNFAIVILCAVLVGFTKTGIPGVGILVIPLMASVFPARASTGILLPMLVMGDVLAVTYYRQHVKIPVLVKIIPFTLIGVLAGYFALRVINDTEMNYLIGSIVLVLVILTMLQEINVIPERAIPKNILLAIVLGVLAGFTTMVANAAGPIIIVYLLAMNLDKEEFIGTGSWYYLLVNAIKIPLSWSLGLITPESLLFNVKFFVFILFGGLLGIYTLHRISPKQFRYAAIALSAVASIKMFF